MPTVKTIGVFEGLQHTVVHTLLYTLSRNTEQILAVKVPDISFKEVETVVKQISKLLHKSLPCK